MDQASVIGSKASRSARPEGSQLGPGGLSQSDGGPESGQATGIHSYQQILVILSVVHWVLCSVVEDIINKMIKTGFLPSFR